MGLSRDFSQKDYFQIVTKYVGRVFMKLTTGWPGLVQCQSVASLSLYPSIVLISANEVNLCQDLTNYLNLPGLPRLCWIDLVHSQAPSTVRAQLRFERYPSVHKWFLNILGERNHSKQCCKLLSV